MAQETLQLILEQLKEQKKFNKRVEAKLFKSEEEEEHEPDDGEIIADDLGEDEHDGVDQDEGNEKDVKLILGSRRLSRNLRQMMEQLCFGRGVSHLTFMPSMQSSKPFRITRALGQSAPGAEIRPWCQFRNDYWK